MTNSRAVELSAINQLGAAAHDVRCLRGEMRFELKDQPLASMAAESTLNLVLGKLDARIDYLFDEMEATLPSPGRTDGKSGNQEPPIQNRT